MYPHPPHLISNKNFGNLRFLLKRSPKKPSPALPRFSAAAALCPQLRAGNGTQRLELSRGPAQATAVEVEPGGKNTELWEYLALKKRCFYIFPMYMFV